MNDQQLPTLFHATTGDHQNDSVQANVTYRFSDPVSVASRLDFARCGRRLDHRWARTGGNHHWPAVPKPRDRSDRRHHVGPVHGTRRQRTAHPLDRRTAGRGGPGQAGFFLRTRRRSLLEVQARHDFITAALDGVRAAVLADSRRAEVERADLSRFMFTNDDLIAVVEQDVLVANTATYLHG